MQKTLSYTVLFQVIIITLDNCPKLKAGIRFSASPKGKIMKQKISKDVDYIYDGLLFCMFHGIQMMMFRETSTFCPDPLTQSRGVDSP